MSNSTSRKYGFKRFVKTSWIGSFVLSFIKNPVNFLYTGLGLFVLIISFENSFSDTPTQKGFLVGSIEFGHEGEHVIQCDAVSASIRSESGQKVLSLTATNQQSKETIYVKIFQLRGTGTYFIPGDGESGNIGNIIHNVDDFRNKNNFYEAKMPDSSGVQNGVGRLNITYLSDTEIEGNLVLIGNNPKGQKAVLESSKFKVSIVVP
jgi:hypothetical protein